ncbi:MAG: hypothetical protein ACKOCH_12620, partial [Bacteroidota bacterium]
STMSTWRSNQLSYGPQLTPFVTGAQRYCPKEQYSKCHEKKSPPDTMQEPVFSPASGGKGL